VGEGVQGRRGLFFKAFTQFQDTFEGGEAPAVEEASERGRAFDFVLQALDGLRAEQVASKGDGAIKKEGVVSSLAQGRRQSRQG